MIRFSEIGGFKSIFIFHLKFHLKILKIKKEVTICFSMDSEYSKKWLKVSFSKLLIKSVQKHGPVNNLVGNSTLVLQSVGGIGGSLACCGGSMARGLKTYPRNKVSAVLSLSAGILHGGAFCAYTANSWAGRLVGTHTLVVSGMALGMDNIAKKIDEVAIIVDCVNKV